MLIGHLAFSVDDSILTQRTLRLRIGAADVSMAMDRVAAKLRDMHQVAGFRKGKAPLAVVRKHFADGIAAEAFQELKRSTLDQVFNQPDFKATDKPLLPPDVIEPEKLKLGYRQDLEFAVRYWIDPAGITRNPQYPQPNQGQFMPGSRIEYTTLSMPGGMSCGKLPAIPGLPELPVL